MRTSQKGIDLIKEFESLHDGDLKKPGLQPNMDPVGIWTEGYGRAMRDDKGNFLRGAGNKAIAEKIATIHTGKEAEDALKQDLQVYENIVAKKIKVPITQNQFDALVSHTYNTGGSDGLFKLVNDRAPSAAIRNWFITKYITAGGKVLNGLIRRRKAEADLFFSM
ncbi:lysozyme [Chryseobacterium gallinarum]|uniref:Lysozyme n=1 Tax=Chryseobacterium gallinarum TaxID=1324352 RepID=A0ABX6KUF8_CHRGL|nr:lysozyme [Chryseobacterium gallinarum]QIY92252.1 lysozyme [Chryseobacterium gallinarum]